MQALLDSVLTVKSKSHFLFFFPLYFCDSVLSAQCEHDLPESSTKQRVKPVANLVQQVVNCREPRVS